MSYFRNRGCQLHYEEYGQGPPVLLLHGLGSSTCDWEHQRKALAASYKVILFDLRGHGRSDRPRGPYSIAGFAEDVIELLAAIPEVMEIHATSGREDLLVRIGAVSHAELQELIQRIVALPGVGHSNTTLALTTPLTYRVGPLIAKATKGAGWGRSTALPEQYRG